jgi:ribosomal-protein-alanine N-acetyltransferase
MHAIVETERLILRRFTLDDLDAFHALGTDPELIRYVGNAPFASREAARECLINAPLTDYDVHGYGRFACVWKASGAVIGFSGVKYLADMEETELGYRFLRPYWGMGLATESARASIDFARDTLGLKRLIGLAHEDNHGSAAIMNKLGFAVERQIDEDGTAFNVFARAL